MKSVILLSVTLKNAVLILLASMHALVIDGQERHELITMACFHVVALTHLSSMIISLSVFKAPSMSSSNHSSLPSLITI